MCAITVIRAYSSLANFFSSSSSSCGSVATSNACTAGALHTLPTPWLTTEVRDGERKHYRKSMEQMTKQRRRRRRRRFLTVMRWLQLRFDFNKLCAWRHNMPPPRPLYARCGPPPVHSLHALLLRRQARLAP